MSNRKYRIAERAGLFIIEVFTTKQVGMLWWKHEVEQWERANLVGWPCSSVSRAVPPMDIFFSLDDAKKQLEYWLTEPKYHYID